MFAPIGVDIEWRRGFMGCGAQDLRISLELGAPKTVRHDALGYSVPADNSIHVYYRQITSIVDASSNNTRVPVVLAHVFVHEITHVLEGGGWHSSTGIMKAQWDEKDFIQMFWKPLRFESADVESIHRALALREHSLLSAVTPFPLVIGSE